MSIDNEILAREAELRQAQLSGDVAALDQLLDDRLLFTSFDRTLATKRGQWRLIAGHMSAAS